MCLDHDCSSFPREAKNGREVRVEFGAVSEAPSFEVLIGDCWWYHRGPDRGPVQETRHIQQCEGSFLLHVDCHA